MDHCSVKVKLVDKCMEYKKKKLRLYQLPISFAQLVSQRGFGDGSGRREILRFAKTIDILNDSDYLRPVNEAYMITVNDITLSGYSLDDLGVFSSLAVSMMSRFNISGEGKVGRITNWDGVRCNRNGQIAESCDFKLFDYNGAVGNLFRVAVTSICKKNVPASLLRAFDMSTDLDMPVVVPAIGSTKIEVERGTRTKGSLPVPVVPLRIMHNDMEIMRENKLDSFVLPYVGGTWCYVQFSPQTLDHYVNVKFFTTTDMFVCKRIGSHHPGYGIVGGFLYTRAHGVLREKLWDSIEDKTKVQCFQPVMFVRWTVPNTDWAQYNVEENVQLLRQIDSTLKYEFFDHAEDSFCPSHPQVATLIARIADPCICLSWNGTIVSTAKSAFIIPLVGYMTTTLKKEHVVASLVDKVDLTDCVVARGSKYSYRYCRNIAGLLKYSEWLPTTDSSFDLPIAMDLKICIPRTQHTQSYDCMISMITEVWDINIRDGRTRIESPIRMLRENGLVGYYWYSLFYALGYIAKKCGQYYWSDQRRAARWKKRTGQGFVDTRVAKCARCDTTDVCPC